MIGLLPKSLIVEDIEYPINSDYRAILIALQALNDNALSPMNKVLTLLEIIFTPVATEDNPDPQTNIPPNYEEASKEIKKFIDVEQEVPKSKLNVKTIDYKQDEQILFSAVNAVTGYDIRETSYMHWWTFYGLCQAIDRESLMSHITNIRYKRSTGEKLEKYEQKFYRENAHLIDIKTSGDFYDEMVKQLRR